MRWSGAVPAAMLAACLSGAACLADTYPAKPIRVVIGFSAGGGADISARTVTKKMGELLGTSFVIENRTGAGGSLAAQLVANGTPDGYTLLWGSVGALTVNSLLQSGIGYDASTGFSPISRTLTFCNALITQPASPVTSIARLIELAKASPGAIGFGSQGVGSAGHLSGELFTALVGIHLLHVPYRGAPEIITSVVGGEVPLGFVSAIAASHIRSRVRVVAVTSAARDPALPDVPTFREAGVPAYDVTFWYGLLAPAHTPDAVVALLNRQVRAALAAPEVEQVLQRHGFGISPGTPEQFAQVIRSDTEKWKRVMKKP